MWGNPYVRKVRYKIVYLENHFFFLKIQLSQNKKFLKAISQNVTVIITGWYEVMIVMFSIFSKNFFLQA